MQSVNKRFYQYVHCLSCVRQVQTGKTIRNRLLDFVGKDTAFFRIVQELQQGKSTFYVQKHVFRVKDSPIVHLPEPRTAAPFFAGLSRVCRGSIVTLPQVVRREGACCGQSVVGIAFSLAEGEGGVYMFKRRYFLPWRIRRR